MPLLTQGHLRVIFLAAPMLAGVAGCSRGAKHDHMTQGDTKQDTAMHASAAAPATSPASPTVSIDNFSFEPTTITVAPGTTITWVNHDDVPHTVTADNKGFASTALDTDDRYSRRFTTPGTYRYFCALHTHMTGEVVVKQ